MNSILDQILENNPDGEFLKADGFDDAVIGVCSTSSRLIYSCTLMIKVLINIGMSELEAIEYLYYNVIGAYVGEQTPIYSDDLNIRV